ncbi:LuxR family transcriptional regulator [Streptomyces sp. JJ38]|uniref:helix-turn-helix transcriptional regulator n=1 Tax=Streptomyces sp. JJ38 TaxID=2738128 RepID=UPI001C582CAA|nr:LuxR C-terminal-related transcriptional regulator [Streptomyces sp. JJ38]
MHAPGGAIDDHAGRPADDLTPSAPPLVGRSALLRAVETRLAAGGSVVLTGPAGIGKTALLATLATAARTRGENVLRVTVPRRPPPRTPQPPPDTPTLLLVDDAQWLHPRAVEAVRRTLARASGRLPPAPVRAVVAGRWTPRLPTDVAPDAAPWRPAPDAVELPVPPLSPEGVARLLDPHGLPVRLTNKLHADSGGNPRLALALAAAYADRVPRPGRPAPLPPEVAALLTERLATLPDAVRDTLLAAALADPPTLPLLLRTGRPAADDHIARAATAGLLLTDGDTIRFTPPAAADVIAAQAGAARRAALHITLAAATTDPAARARHQALAATDPDAALAHRLTRAAGTARRKGDHRAAAELYLLAAERTPAAPLAREADRLDRLLAAARSGATAAHGAVVHRAADAVLRTDAPPAARVAVRLALLDLAGQGFGDMDETFAAALLDAADHPAHLARVRLRLAWSALLDGKPLRAETEADRTVRHARAAADPAIEAMALAVKATVARATGRSDHQAHLDHALRLPHRAPDGWLHRTPRFLAARFAAADDRLHEAREALLRMLAEVGHGTGEETVAVLSALAETCAALGHCREALDYADRAVHLTREAGYSPGPAWYGAAVAELAGGDLTRAAAYADRGVLASEQERDIPHLARHLHALGQARLRTGNLRGGVAALHRLKDLHQARGIDSPHTLRWHADLASGLVALGDLTAATELIHATRATLTAHGNPGGVEARLDRAEAALHAAQGEPDTALALLDAATARFAALGQPLEHGHCLLERARVERRRRRHAAARAATAEALALFTRHAARPWRAQADRHLTHPDDGTVLTVSEERIAALVVGGATNQEVAARMFLSVKTIEASLTRIYRKLGIRSRTQLSTLLHTTHPGT